LTTAADKCGCNPLRAGARGSDSTGPTPVAFPLVVDHHVQNQLHRAALDGARVAVELAAFHPVDVPRDVGRLPVQSKAHEIGRVVSDLACAVVVEAVVRCERLAAAVVVVRHENRVRETAEDLDNVDFRVVAEAWIRRQHPERGEEPGRAGEFHPGLDVAVREREQICRTVVRSRARRRDEPSLVRALPLITGAACVRRRERLGNQLGGPVADLDLRGEISLLACIE
jgi:hypothetical protein